MKPTLFERVISLFSSDMRAILNDPCRIALIDNPSEILQKAAVRQSSTAVMFIDNPTSQVQSLAVLGNPIYIRLVNKPTEMVKNLIVALDARNISFIDNPSPQLQLNAVRKNPETIKLIENPSIEAVYYYINGDYSKLADIQNIPLSIQKKAISANPLNAQYIHNLDKDLQKETLELTSRILNKNKKSEQVQPSNAQSFYKSYTSFEESYATELQDIHNLKIPETDKKQKIENIKEAIKDSKILAVQALSNSLGHNINVKNLFKNISEFNIEPENLRAGEWMQLLSTGKCNIMNKRLSVELIDFNIVTVNNIKTSQHENIKANFDNNKESISTDNIVNKLGEKYKDLKRNIDFKTLVKSIEQVGINPESLKSDQWDELIRQGKTTLNENTLNLKKTPSGYNVSKGVISNISVHLKTASSIKQSTEKLNAEAEIQN